MHLICNHIRYKQNSLKTDFYLFCSLSLQLLPSGTIQFYSLKNVKRRMQLSASKRNTLKPHEKPLDCYFERIKYP